MKCVRCHQDNPSHAKFCLECGTPFTPTRETGPRGQSYEDLQHALTEALQQQTATADVLKVISRSAFDLQTVLDTLCESAVRLCDADHALLFQREGEIFRYAASFGLATEVHARLRDYFKSRPLPANRGSITGRAALEARVVQVVDVLADTEYTRSDAQAIGGWRAALGAPLLREGRVVGVIAVAKTVPQPFTGKQIELVETFADQAVIAIENVRLFTELQGKNAALTEAHAQVTEALEQQTATAEILRVISNSPTDLQPVMDVVAESAARFCGAVNAGILRLEGEVLRLVAQHGPSPSNQPIGATFAVSRGSLTGRVVLDRHPIHIEDFRSDSAQAEFPETAERGRQSGAHNRARTILVTPLLREGVPIGVIWMRRLEVQPFTDKQIQLAKTFADQAVIAIENVRLFNETKEALEQQTATAEILRVISSSPTDLQPVMDAVAASAARLCGATDAAVRRVHGDFLETVAVHGPTWIDRILVQRDVPSGRAVIDAVPIHVHDVVAARRGGPRRVICRQ